MRERILSVSIKDCEVQHFRSGGKGGQNQNCRDTGTRVIHHESGARGESREERSQLQNERTAFLRMVESVAFKRWMGLKLLEGPSPEERVRQEMKPENIRTEVRRDGVWMEVKEVHS
jgi:protein subunit release factor A